MKTIETMPNDTGVFIRIPQELKNICQRNGISFTNRFRAGLVMELIHLYSDGMLAPCDRAWVEEKLLVAPLPKTEREDGFFSIERGLLKFYKAVPADCPTDIWGAPKVYPQKMVLPVVLMRREVSADE